MRKSLIVLLSLSLAATVAAVAAVQTGARPVASDCGGALPTGAFTAYRATATDGNCLQGYAWAPAQGSPVRAALVVVHGLGDHARRYAGLAQALNAQGVAMLAQDQRGHAGSGGARQRIDSVAQAAGDVEQALKEAARRWPGVPLLLHGHSFGGLVVTHLAASGPQALAGVVISSAALQRPPGVSGVQLGVVRTLSALAPGLGLEPLDPTKVLRDPGAQAALVADPLIARDKLPARTVATLLTGIDDIQPQLAQLRQPLLILHGSADTVTPPDGSRALHAKAASTEKTLRIIDAALHDLLHEPEAEAVTQAIVGFATKERR
ncbi:MAG: lysophospholipase [Rubrivivax sp.]|nr:lysophospholipase [Rubrivivax sp.]